MFAVIVLVIVILIMTLIRFYEKNTNAMCTSTKRLDGQVAIVTGGTAGMGLKISKEFARRGAKVYIACPFEDEGNNAKTEIVKETGNKNVIFKLLDLSSIDSVRKFASDIMEDEDRLDILINNAGVGGFRDRITDDGMSFIMQVNYFGHFLLTLLLLPLMKKTGTYGQPSRILNTASFLHWFGVYDIKNLNRPYHNFNYAKSKIALVLFARELTKRLKGTGSHIVINSIDPGLVGTGIFNRIGKLSGVILTNFSYYFFKTPWEGCQTALHVALDPEAAEVSGEYFKNCKRARAIKWAYSDELSSYVWKQSVKLVKISDEEMKQHLE